MSKLVVDLRSSANNANFQALMARAVYSDESRTISHAQGSALSSVDWRTSVCIA